MSSFLQVPQKMGINYTENSRHLFLSLNGAGHNPIVVTETANVEHAVESTLRVTLQNQGQDCAGPNAILVHDSKLSEFKHILKRKLKQLFSFKTPLFKGNATYKKLTTIAIAM